MLQLQHHHLFSIHCGPLSSEHKGQRTSHIRPPSLWAPKNQIGGGLPPPPSPVAWGSCMNAYRANWQGPVQLAEWVGKQDRGPGAYLLPGLGCLQECLLHTSRSS